MAEKPTKKAVYEYWFCYVDNNNKFQNALVDANYEINSRERMKEAREDLRKVTNDNFRAIVNYVLLKKKFIKKTEE